MFIMITMTACDIENANNISNNIIIDSISTTIDSIIIDTDTIPQKNDSIISLSLYKFNNENIYNKILTLVNEHFGESNDDLYITYYSDIDTIESRKNDSIPYCYNLTLNITYGNSHILDAAGYCMIGKRLCYISNNLTKNRLFTKTSKSKHFIYEGYIILCPCISPQIYFILEADNNLLFIDYDY